MDDRFKIYVDQLRDGHLEKIQESYPASFMEVQDSELKFTKDVEVIGEAYLAVDNLVIRLKVATQAMMPCSICNEWVTVDIQLDDLYLSEPTAEIKGAIFDFRDVLREEILLGVPQFAECGNGQCPQRKNFQKYMKQSSDKDDDEGYRPFAEL